MKDLHVPALPGEAVGSAASRETVAAVVDALARVGVGDVLADDASRAHYSSDASLYRVIPTAVVRPRDAEEVGAALAVARAHGIPLVARGAGTSVAGNAVSSGLVVDFSRHMNRILDVDPAARMARVEPGVVQASLQRAARAHGLLFGPDPSTMSRCTIGGMIGNNACGSRSLGYGRTSDNVVALQALTAAGESLDLRSGTSAVAAHDGDAGRLLTNLDQLVRADLATIRTEFATFGRQVSGYSLEHLLPENDFDVTRFLVGTEGSLAVVTEATVRLVAAPAHRTLVVLGFDTMPDAADVVMDVLQHGPTACEGLDARIVDVVRARRGPSAVPPLPAGRAWLFVEVSGDTADECEAKAARLSGSVPCLEARVVLDAVESSALWQIRADGAGLSGRSTANRPAHAGWEDAAVPPARLGAYLRDFEDLLEAHELAGFPFGHFGDGCIHVRLDFPLDRPHGAVVLEQFLTSAAQLVAKYGGSLSGEHGDGRARSQFLPLMYSPQALELFARVKSIFDPDAVLNPGVIIDPPPVTEAVRVLQAPPLRRQLAFAYPHDSGDFSEAVHRCTGVGKCRADNEHGVMCPSYVATRNEKDSTRGRARVLQEMVNGTFVADGWASKAVHETLDLCLACKGCASDCPTGVDMATYKAEVLHQTYKRRVRPVSHYSLGWLPRWSRIASRAPRVVNALMRAPGLSRVALSAAGVDPRRNLPTFAARTFRRSHVATPRADLAPAILFVDTFTESFSPGAAHAAIRVLANAGYHAELVSRSHCCGLTWITTGQLDAAKKLLARTVASLAEHAAAGVPIVGLEPSCTAVLRSDAVELLGTDDARRVAAATVTLSELLTRSGWTPPNLGGVDVVAQPHCHQHAVMGWDVDKALLERANAIVTALPGCCGLAGNFGVEKGHYDVSVAVAEQHLLPAVRKAPQAVVLADGFSCRTQLDDLADVKALHLAELLASALPPDGDTHARLSGGSRPDGVEVPGSSEG
jgi:FAD/FMN-containing dehydrogenase/Fe-S oxidoreductase